MRAEALCWAAPGSLPRRNESRVLVATFATLGVILSAGYALWLYRKVIFGPLTKPSLASIKDLTFREGLTLFPLLALTILFGVYPKPVLDMSAASVQQLVNNYNAAMTAVKAAALIQ